MARKKIGFHWWMIGALILAAICGWALQVSGSVIIAASEKELNTVPATG